LPSLPIAVAATGQNAVGPCAHQNARASPKGVFQIGVERAHAAARHVAKAAKTSDFFVVLAGVHVEHAALEGVAELGRPLLELLVGTIQIAAVIVGVNALEHAVELLVEQRAV
jgi:hypothetical protein